MVVGRNRGRPAKRAAGAAGRSAGKAGLRGGKSRTRRALGPSAGSVGARYAGYGLVVLGGFAVGVLVGL